jgi:rfaE bifunctional protein kinase chain/domain
MLGNDAAGIEVYNYFQDRCKDAGGLLLSSKIETITKTRIMAGDDHTSKQQVIRIDKESETSLPSDAESKVLDYLTGLSPSLDGMVVSDYGYGFITKNILAFIKDFSRRKPVIVDSRYQMKNFRGVTMVTPNQSEAEAVTGITITDDETLSAAGGKLLKLLQLQAVLITQGNRGMTLFEKGKKPSHIPIIGSDEITDVTGAGDTVSSVIGLALGTSASFIDAARLANYAASVVVMKRGTATVTREELLHAIKSEASGK